MRLRSFNPNVLNWPSYITNKLGAGLSSIIKRRAEIHQLPKRLEKYLGVKEKDFPTIRGICMARPGWCVVEADFKTAEMRGLAFISGDEKLKRIILNPDDCFGLPRPECIPEGISAEDCIVRLKFPSYVAKPKDKEKYIFTYASDGIIHCTFTPDQLLRDEKGELVHPAYDMHWQICELSRHVPREEMNKKRDRGAAKVVTFSSAYGATASSLARKVEADTGSKVTEEEAQALLNAIEERQPRATIFFHEMEEAPVRGEPFIRAASGRKRHLRVLGQLSGGMWNPARKSSITALGRECRNFKMQESVAATASLASINILDFLLIHPELKGYPIVCLYDSLVIHCPEEEREIWKKVLELYMHARNGWWYEGDILRYPIDTEVNAGWSTKATGRKYEELHDPEYKPTPKELKGVEDWLDAQIALFNDYPDLSVYNEWDMKKKS